MLSEGGLILHCSLFEVLAKEGIDRIYGRFLTGGLASDVLEGICYVWYCGTFEPYPDVSKFHTPFHFFGSNYIFVLLLNTLLHCPWRETVPIVARFT